MTAEELRTRFTYHAPHGDQPERYQQLRDMGLSIAELIVDLTPDHREQAIALTKLEEVIFWANAAIARREPRPAD
jgi:hypothetical protein